MNHNVMRTTSRRGLAALVFCAVLSATALFSAASHAQDYPTRTVKIVVSQAPGSSADVIARTLAAKLAVTWSTAVIVENRPGANGNIGMDFVAKAAPDGYTLGLATPSVMTINPQIYKAMPFRPLEDLTAVTETTSITFGLFCNPALPVKSVADLVAYAKSKPDGINISSAGIGNLGHLSAELFASQAGIKLTHVPDKGDTPALLDVAGGHTDAAFTPMPSAVSLMQGGKIRLLGIASPARSQLFPNAPTLAESGLPQVIVEGWTGLVAPAGTPPRIVALVQKAVRDALGDPDVKKIVQLQGFEIAGGSSDDFAQLMKRETQKWHDVIKAASIKLMD
jgi:tripartite-type tricarboxylate transporter receptor subunit TctC